MPLTWRAIVGRFLGVVHKWNWVIVFPLVWDWIGASFLMEGWRPGTVPHVVCKKVGCLE